MTGSNGKPKGDHKNRDRVQQFRQQRKADGWQPYELWLDPETSGLLSELKQPREALHALMCRALHALRTQDERLLFLNPVQRRAAIMARLAEMTASGLSNQQIADQLNGAGIPTFSGEGQWDRKTIQRLLKQAEKL